MQGSVLLSMEILPSSLAEDEFKNGAGRSEPNVHPYLPPPTGRMKWVSYVFSYRKFYCLGIVHFFAPPRL